MMKTVLTIVTTLVINVKSMNLATRGTFSEVGGRIFDTPTIPRFYKHC